jgi:hypothetical protein
VIPCAHQNQLFILEGIPAILCSVYTWLYLPNYPETADFLSDEERAALIADLPKQAPKSHAKTLDYDQVLALFKSPTFVPFLIVWATHGIGGWGISFVLPTVIYELGISDTAIAQVMTMVNCNRSKSSRANAFSLLLHLFSLSCAAWRGSSTPNVYRLGSQA